MRTALRFLRDRHGRHEEGVGEVTQPRRDRVRADAQALGAQITVHTVRAEAAGGVAKAPADGRVA